MTAWVLAICMGSIGSPNVCAYEKQIPFSYPAQCYEALRTMRFAGDPSKVVHLAYCHERVQK